MRVYPMDGLDLKRLEPLVNGWKETMIRSCLEGCMGEAYAVDRESPCSAQLAVADFCFFAGRPEAALVENGLAGGREFVIMCTDGSGWNTLIETIYAGAFRKVTRYAFEADPESFDKVKLNRLSRSLPAEYEVKRIDSSIYHRTFEERWSADLCGQFKDADDYKKRGLGMAVLHKNRLVAGASSYTVYSKGIEIEIDTKMECRRKGLAAAAGAALILECLRRGLYPGWDAQNPGSAALAEKLGYRFFHEYSAYEITGSHI